jgi:hypothetical protein
MTKLPGSARADPKREDYRRSVVPAQTPSVRTMLLDRARRRERFLVRGYGVRVSS